MTGISRARLAGVGGDVLRLESRIERSQTVTHTSAVIDSDNPTLRDALDGRGGLIVCTPSVERWYGSQLRHYLETVEGAPTQIVVIGRTEATKNLSAAAEICDAAAAFGLRRTAPIVAIGGGICTDIVGAAAAMYRRGVPHIKVPTTLIGLVDAGIGTKNALNHADHKSLVGSFHAPEHSILDRSFLTTLPRRHLVNGMAEIVKLAVVTDSALFDRLERDAPALLDSAFVAPAETAEFVVRTAVAQMLSELSENLYETHDYRRAMDFGHTFSPYVERASRHAVLHGEAVAMDVALSSQIAHDRGMLSTDDLDRILDLLGRVGLALCWPQASPEAAFHSLTKVLEHRDGNLHWAVPTSVGSCGFLEIDDVAPATLAAALQRLAARGHQHFDRQRWSSESAAVA